MHARPRARQRPDQGTATPTAAPDHLAQHTLSEPAGSRPRMLGKTIEATQTSPHAHRSTALERARSQPMASYRSPAGSRPLAIDAVARGAASGLGTATSLALLAIACARMGGMARPWLATPLLLRRRCGRLPTATTPSRLLLTFLVRDPQALHGRCDGRRLGRLRDRRRQLRHRLRRWPPLDITTLTGCLRRRQRPPLSTQFGRWWRQSAEFAIGGRDVDADEGGQSAGWLLLAGLFLRLLLRLARATLWRLVLEHKAVEVLGHGLRALVIGGP